MMGRHGDVIDDLQEYRVSCVHTHTTHVPSTYTSTMQGQSWSIGMDNGAETVPNFLSNYRDKIIGGSLGHHLGEVSH